MKDRRNERGAISVGLVVTIIVALFLIYEAKQFGPLLVAQYQFQDQVIETCKFSVDKQAPQVYDAVLRQAAELNLPITRDMVKVTRQATKTRIQVQYQLTAEWLPGRPYTWNVTVDEQSAIF
jgi:hypothetical protein